jgi:hypothetical protein
MSANTPLGGLSRSFAAIFPAPPKWTKRYLEQIIDRSNKRIQVLQDRIGSVRPGRVLAIMNIFMAEMLNIVRDFGGTYENTRATVVIEIYETLRKKRPHTLDDPFVVGEPVLHLPLPHAIRIFA